MPAALTDLPALLTPAEAADLLRTTPGTLNVWRCTGRVTLPYIQRGRSVLYRRADIEKYLDRETITPGSAD